MENVLAQFSQVVGKFPDRIAITHYASRDQKTDITFSELDQRASRCADYLQRSGVHPGDLVGVYMHRHIEHVVATLAILKSGAAAYSINIRAMVPQVNYILGVSRTKFLFIDNTALLTLGTSEEILPDTIELVHCAGAKMNPVHEQLLEKIRTSAHVQTHPCAEVHFPVGTHCPVVNHDTALVLFTSGSTGLPKGVMISHQDLINRALTECRYFSITAEDCLLSLLPFSFDVGCNQMFTALMTGARLLILNSWLPGDICSVINTCRVTGISGVPAIWTGMLDAADESMAKALSAVRYITVSGGDLPLPQLERLQRLAGAARIFKTYGQTETFRSSILQPEEYDKKMASVGRPVRGTEVIILNKKGMRATANEAGEIIHRGDGMMLGYLADVPATRKKIRKNPLRNADALTPQFVVYTGDIGKIDEDGYLYILGRKDKMIKTSGYRVYPREITDRVTAYPAVKEAVVFGVADEKIGKRIHCVIQLKPEAAATEQEIRHYLAARLPSYMVPAKIYFTDSFPRTESGKIKNSEVEKAYNA
ncbi:MAG: AMP-binding protein [Proteobacteria bacterium]|nr:AMP-binding protein [Pseudomonadota bacterium]